MVSTLMASTSVLIYNPAAGGRRSAAHPRRIREILAAGGRTVDLAPTAAPGDATDLARAAAQSGCDAVYVLGGDGTLREAAAGLMGGETALGALPGGTINVVAASLGLPSRPAAAATRLREATVREMDVGLCDDQPFLILTSVGLDGRIMARVPPRLKRHLGRLAVGLEGARDWWSYDYPEVKVVADGRELHGTFAAACNLSRYGGSTRLAPRARPDSGRLELIVFRGRGRRATLAFAADLLLGRHTQRSDVVALAVDEVRFLGPATLPLEIDGDGMALAPPHEIRLSAKRLRVLSPI